MKSKPRPDYPAGVFLAITFTKLSTLRCQVTCIYHRKPLKIFKNLWFSGYASMAS
jgi:hypothetical protein